jgi:hypothetical protein
MAARDIMPWFGRGGTSPSTRWGQMTASEVFEIGEPVAIVDAGTLTEPPDDATQFIITDIDGGLEAGIACFGPGAGNINPVTGVAFATGDDIAYWPINDGTVFITQNFFAAGAGSDVAPVQTDVGEPYQVAYNTTATIGWGVEQTAGVYGVDVVATILEVLDTNKDPIRITGNAGVYVLFTLNATIGAA